MADTTAYSFILHCRLVIMHDPNKSCWVIILFIIGKGWPMRQTTAQDLVVPLPWQEKKRREEKQALYGIDSLGPRQPQGMQGRQLIKCYVGLG